MKKCARLCVATGAMVALTFSLTAGAQRGDDAALAAKYLNDHEPELAQTAAGVKTLYLLLKLAPAALAAGEKEKARTYATELIALGESLESKPGFGTSHYSDATHIGNLVHGQLALK